MPMTQRQERLIFYVIITVAVLALPANEISRYIAVQSIKNNTDANFASRSQEHLQQEKLSVAYHDLAMQFLNSMKDEITAMDDKIDNLTSQIKELRNDSIIR
jgi:hypothetical protein